MSNTALLGTSGEFVGSRASGGHAYSGVAHPGSGTPAMLQWLSTRWYKWTTHMSHHSPIVGRRIPHQRRSFLARLPLTRTTTRERRSNAELNSVPGANRWIT